MVKIANDTGRARTRPTISISPRTPSKKPKRTLNWLIQYRKW